MNLSLTHALTDTLGFCAPFTKSVDGTVTLKGILILELFRGDLSTCACVMGQQEDMFILTLRRKTVNSVLLLTWFCYNLEIFKRQNICTKRIINKSVGGQHMKTKQEEMRNGLAVKSPR